MLIKISSNNNSIQPKSAIIANFSLMGVKLHVKTLKFHITIPLVVSWDYDNEGKRFKLTMTYDKWFYIIQFWHWSSQFDNKTKHAASLIYHTSSFIIADNNDRHCHIHKNPSIIQSKYTGKSKIIISGGAHSFILY